MKKIDLTSPVEIWRCSLPRKDYAACDLTMFNLSSEQVTSVEVTLILLDGKGTLRVNAPQLEKNAYANPYNLVENGNFENGQYGWTVSPTGVTATAAACCFGNFLDDLSCMISLADEVVTY